MSKSNKKPELWRIVVFIIAVLFIVFMWAKKDIAEIYATMPKEQIVPMIATTVAVSILKVALIAGAVLLIKWLISKFKKEHK